MPLNYLHPRRQKRNKRHFLLTVYTGVDANPIKFKASKWKTGVGDVLVVKAMDCGIVVREFVLQSRYYIHFLANTLGKGMNPLILPAMG